jgi:hypothetical protein
VAKTHGARRPSLVAYTFLAHVVQSKTCACTAAIVCISLNNASCWFLPTLAARFGTIFYKEKKKYFVVLHQIRRVLEV